MTRDTPTTASNVMADAPDDGRSRTEDMVMRILGAVLEEDASAVHGADRLAGYSNWDSVSTLEVLAGIERQAGVRLDLRKFHDAQAVEDLIDLVWSEVQW